MAEFVSDRAENNVGKAENAGYQHFHFFPCLLKVCVPGCLKPGKFEERLKFQPRSTGAYNNLFMALTFFLFFLTIIFDSVERVSKCFTK